MKILSIIAFYLLFIFLSLFLGKTTIDFQNNIFNMKCPILGSIFLILSTVWFIFALYHK